MEEYPVWLDELVHTKHAEKIGEAKSPIAPQAHIVDNSGHHPRRRGGRRFERQGVVAYLYPALCRADRSVDAVVFLNQVSDGFHFRSVHSTTGGVQVKVVHVDLVGIHTIQDQLTIVTATW